MTGHLLYLTFPNLNELLILQVVGIVITNRPDSKNAQYQQCIKQGDILLNRLVMIILMVKTKIFTMMKCHHHWTMHLDIRVIIIFQGAEAVPRDQHLKKSSIQKAAMSQHHFLTIATFPIRRETQSSLYGRRLFWDGIWCVSQPPLSVMNISSEINLIYMRFKAGKGGIGDVI